VFNAKEPEACEDRLQVYIIFFSRGYSITGPPPSPPFFFIFFFEKASRIGGRGSFQTLLPLVFPPISLAPHPEHVNFSDTSTFPSDISAAFRPTISSPVSSNLCEQETHSHSQFFLFPPGLPRCFSGFLRTSLRCS